MITSYYVCSHAYRKNVINKHPHWKLIETITLTITIGNWHYSRFRVIGNVVDSITELRKKAKSIWSFFSPFIFWFINRPLLDKKFFWGSELKFWGVRVSVRPDKKFFFLFYFFKIFFLRFRTILFERASVRL